jgi:hypothetical protein
MGAITEIFRTFGPEYLQRHPQAPEQHRKTIKAIINCRSGEYGSVFYQCEACGQKHRVERSCGNRHCPQCQFHKSRRWLADQLNKTLPVPHFMLTFTVPALIRPFCRSNQQKAYSAMFKASSEAIKLIAKDQRFVGAELSGFTGVLHTWGRLLPYHPHIHYIVPAGGLSKSRNLWVSARNTFYLPVKALSKIYRAKFKDELKKHQLLDVINPAVWKAPWIVNCQPVGKPEASLKYLAPYVFRVAISDSRILEVKDRLVTFSFKKTGSSRFRKTTIDVMEFIRRFIQHVLPCGFMKVRHYGFMNPNCAIDHDSLYKIVIAGLKDLALLLGDPEKPSTPTIPYLPVCAGCGGKLIYLGSFIPRLGLVSRAGPD